MTTLSPASANKPDQLVQLRRKSDEPPNSTPQRKYANHSFSPGLYAATNHTSSPQATPTPLYGSLLQSFGSPGVGGAGEQRSLIQTPKPAFPLNVQVHNEEEVLHRVSAPSLPPLQPPPPPVENIDYSSPYIKRQRALSVFEEESETESVSELPQQQPQGRQPSSSPTQPSPLHPPSPHQSPRTRSRWLSNARSSPNLLGSVSKSDVSDDEEDEEDDDIVELMTTSGRYPNKNSTFPRTSPGNSPLLTSRRSPTHYLTGSSDEELCNVFETGHKHRSKRIGGYRKRSIPNKLVPMDSISSDDGINMNQNDVTRRPARKDRLLRLRACNSLPATPADNSGSESLTELLDSLRRNRSGSCRTDSSLSDGGGGSGEKEKDMKNLANSMMVKFDLSDEDSGGHVAMETDAGSEVRRTSTTLRSVFCTIL